MSNRSHWHAHRRCVVCGQKNPLGLQADFQFQPDQTVLAYVLARPAIEGYEGIVQGGVTAALLDSAMANVLYWNGFEALTAELNIRFIAEIPLGCTMMIIGKRDKTRKKLHWTSAEIWVQNQLVASATGKFMTRK